jgi:5-methylcytosine-specific restriction endonuclease McrA
MVACEVKKHYPLRLFGRYKRSSRWPETGDIPATRGIFIAFGGCLTSHKFGARLMWCCHWTWWIHRPAHYRPTSGRLKVMRQPRQACSPQRESPFELFCRYLHPRQHDTVPPLACEPLKRKPLQGIGEHPAGHSTSMGSVGCQSFRPLMEAQCQTVASSFTRRHEPHAQRFVSTDKMGIHPPPLQVSQQVGSLLLLGPGATSQRRYPMSDGQWSPLDKCRVQPRLRSPSPVW